MRFFELVLSATLASATSLNLLGDLEKRQDAFVPPSTPVESCPSGWLQCGVRDCILVSRGDVCCSEGYGCPTGSFCLTQGYCCPDGEDPTTCALNNGVTLTAGFNTAPVAASSAAASSAVASSSVAAVTTSTSPASASSYSAPSYTLPGTPGLSNYTAKPTNTVTPFTGGGNQRQAAMKLVGAAVGAFVWAML